MAESWVRLWAGMTTDPKWQTIARKSGQPRYLVIALYSHLLMIGNESETRGNVSSVSYDDIASALDCGEDQVTAIMQAMEGRVIENGRLSGWDKRQPVREDSGNEQTGAKSSTERVREFRRRQKTGAKEGQNATSGNAMKRDETQRNAPDTETESDSESEKPSTPHTVSEPERPPRDSAAESAPVIPVSPAGAICLAIREEGIPTANPSHPTLIALIEAGADPNEFRHAAREAVAKGKPDFAYVVGTVRRRREEAAALVLHRGQMPGAPPGNGRQSRIDNYAAQAAAARGEHGEQHGIRGTERDITGEAERIA